MRPALVLLMLMCADSVAGETCSRYELTPTMIVHLAQVSCGGSERFMRDRWDVNLDGPEARVNSTLWKIDLDGHDETGRHVRLSIDREGPVRMTLDFDVPYRSRATGRFTLIGLTVDRRPCEDDVALEVR